jgi:NAD-dependent deacetylase
LISSPPKSIIILTGAGISAESGIRTFRASDGLWEDHRVEDVASPQGFQRDPALVHAFYNARRRQLLNGILPNAGHKALSRLQREFSGTVTLVTQNIDNLHELAGSPSVIHMHGELLKSRCSRSNKLWPCVEDISTDSICACCNMPGTLRPHVVWFGEMPLAMDIIYRELEMCDLFLSVGTSGNVYPAAGFFQVARQAGATTVELNLEASANAADFDYHAYGPATKILPEFVDKLLNNSF